MAYAMEVMTPPVSVHSAAAMAAWPSCQTKRAPGHCLRRGRSSLDPTHLLLHPNACYCSRRQRPPSLMCSMSASSCAHDAGAPDYQLTLSPSSVWMPSGSSPCYPPAPPWPPLTALQRRHLSDQPCCCCWKVTVPGGRRHRSLRQPNGPAVLPANLGQLRRLDPQRLRAVQARRCAAARRVSAHQSSWTR
jgi:hypothetical protein